MEDDERFGNLVVLSRSEADEASQPLHPAPAEKAEGPRVRPIVTSHSERSAAPNGQSIKWGPSARETRESAGICVQLLHCDDELASRATNPDAGSKPRTDGSCRASRLQDGAKPG